MPETLPPRLDRAGQPAALKWVTVPLLVMLLCNAVMLLITPFSSDALYPIVKESLRTMNLDQALTPAFMQQFIWTMFFMFMAATAVLYFVWEGAKAGRRWAWIASMLVGVLSLFAFPPISSVLGLILLFGVFQAPVRAYFNRENPENLQP